MFQFFSVPRINYSYYRPKIYHRRYIPVESYLLNSIRQAQEFENLKKILYNSIFYQQHKEQPLKQNATEKQNENNNDNINEQQAVETPKVHQKNVSPPSPIYYFESYSTFDGKKLVEERKERKIDSEGKVHQKLKRRLGDQWYETEQIEDKEGQIITKEKWHNVPEDEVENFKDEWLSKTGQNKLELAPDCNEEPESDKKEIELKSTEKEERENENETNEESKNENETNEKESKNENETNEKESKNENEIQTNDEQDPLFLEIDDSIEN